MNGGLSNIAMNGLHFLGQRNLIYIDKGYPIFVVKQVRLAAPRVDNSRKTFRRKGIKKLEFDFDLGEGVGGGRNYNSHPRKD